MTAGSLFDLLSADRHRIFILHCQVFTRVSVQPWTGTRECEALPGRYVHTERNTRIEWGEVP